VASVAEKYEMRGDFAWDYLHEPPASDRPVLIDPTRVHPPVEWLETTHDPGPITEGQRTREDRARTGRYAARVPMSLLALTLIGGWLCGCTGDGSQEKPAAVASTTASSAADDSTTEPDGVDLDELVAYTRTLVPHYDLSVPGGVVLITDGTEARGFAFGQTHLDPDRPMKATERFPVGSNTKTMVAVVVLQLIDEAKLSLHDTVEHWKPGLMKDGDEVTIENLLSHRSGIYDPTVVGHFGIGLDITDENLATILDHPLTDPPGTQSRYSNPNYWVLGKIVEAVTSRPLARELQERVFEPAAMSTATLATNLDRERRHPTGYNANDRDITPGDFTAAWAAGGVVATAPDLESFYRALYAGDLLDPGTVKDMFTSRGTLPDGPGYGLGTFIVDIDCRTEPVTGHFGQVNGFTSAAMRDPSTGITVVTLINASGTHADDAVGSLTFRTLCRD
jgi:D-alanyl-D-alanine carboxypeptidase